MGGFLGGLIGGAAGPLINAGAQAAATAAQFGITKKLQKRGYRFSRQYRQTQYQDMIASLEAAGLNPLLALGASPSPGGFSAPSFHLPTGADLASSARAGSLVAEQFKQAKAETARKQNEAEASEILPEQARAELARTRSESSAASAAAVRGQVNAWLESLNIPMASATARFYRENEWARRWYLYRNSMGEIPGTALGAQEFAEKLGLPRGLKDVDTSGAKGWLERTFKPGIEKWKRLEKWLDEKEKEWQ